MKKPKYETFENDILKADLMLSDYTLATDPEEKRSISIFWIAISLNSTRPILPRSIAVWQP